MYKSIASKLKHPGILFVIFIFIGKAEGIQPEGIVLEVKYKDFIPVNLKKYGVNGALLGSKLGYGDDQLVDIYNNIGITFTRFPGGTIGNYYNWQSGNFSCYRTPDERAEKRIKRMNRALKKTDTSYTVNDFFGFVKATGTGFTYMLNIMCDSVGSNLKLLKFMKKSNVDLKFIEMGNEIYSGGYSWAYKNAETYIKDAEKNYLAIKSTYPDAKLGLVITPISFSGKHAPLPNGVPDKSWPKRIRDFDLLSGKASFSDALVIHIYGHPYRSKWMEPNPVTFQEHYSAVIGPFNKKFDTSMQYLKSLGANKPVWITEWGVSAPVNKRIGLFREYKKSAFHALYVASVLASITLEDGVEVANYHGIGDLWKLTKDGYEITPTGDVLSVFVNSAKFSNRVYDVLADSKITDIKALLYETDNGDKLIVINEGNKSYVINKLISNNNRANYKVEAMYIKDDVFKASSNIYSNGIDHDAGIKVRPFSILRISQIKDITKLK